MARTGVLNAKSFYYLYGARRGVPFNSITAKRFTGHAFGSHEASLPGGKGLSFYNARWYDPKLGSFLSADSIVPAPLDPQSFNRYAYAGGNPLRFSDPSGHTKLCGAACEDGYKWSPVTKKKGGGTGGGAANFGGGGGGRSYFGGGNRITGSASIYGPLTRTQWEVSNRAARVFGLPPELVAGTVAVEITDDTDWYDTYLDLVFQEMPLSYHYSSCASGSGGLGCSLVGRFLEGYEHYFGLLGGRGPGNGVSNVHIATAKEAEAYFATHYPGQALLPTPPDHFARAAILLSDSGNIYYTAAILRMTADYRTGVRSAHTPLCL